MKLCVTDSRIASIHTETGSGTPIAKLCWKHGTSDAVFINGASVKDVAGAKLIAATRQPQCFSEPESRFNDIYRELFTLHIPCSYFPGGTAQRAESSVPIWRPSSATASLAATTMAS